MSFNWDKFSGLQDESILVSVTKRVGFCKTLRFAENFVPTIGMLVVVLCGVVWYCIVSLQLKE